MITAPILAATRYRYFGSCHAISTDPEASAVSSGWARQATNKNTTSNAPTTIAILSTARYEPRYAMTISATTISDIVTAGGTPMSRPTPAKPLSSLNSAPTQDSTKVATESHA